MSKSRVISACVAGIWVAVVGSKADAMRMVEGGFGLDQRAVYAPAELTWTAPSGQLISSSQQIGFTPRHHSFLGLGGEPTTLSMGMNIDAHYGGGLDFKRPESGNDVSQRFLVGGAIRVEEIGLLGGIGRTVLFGEQTDLVSAGMSLGGLRASVALGETENEVEGAREVMMLSTDLRVSSWFSVRGDLAVSERNDQRESLAVGRVGVKLRF